MVQSNEPTVEAKNLAIAEFMNLEQDWHYYSAVRSRVFLSRGIWYKAHKLRYHISWDWLMPVWARFREVVSDHFDEDYPAEYCSMCDIWALQCEHANIAGAHNLLYDAIQWYNQQRQANVPE